MTEVVSIPDIAVSGLRANRTRMNVIANNIANSLTTRTAKGGAFRRQLAILRGEQISPSANPASFGVRVRKIVDDPSPFRTVFDPGHPDADEAGYVDYPNVNLAVEMVNLVSAQRGYEANVAILVSNKRMTQKALEIIQA
ncbi:MAG: flagellar basal body rod protein FlgC [Candidatus Hydrogenedentes bacterium]|nr:flagellar basal body rod protein FlgC [Candidatus Hydrogenedentota bacterium]